MRLHSSETQAQTYKRQVLALTSVLQQRQEREQQTTEYCHHLETAIREHNIFPQITSRVNQLLASGEPLSRSAQDEAKLKIEFDSLRRDLEVAKLQLR